jgi:hypothetical protein
MSVYVDAFEFLLCGPFECPGCADLVLSSNLGRFQSSLEKKKLFLPLSKLYSF